MTGSIPQTLGSAILITKGKKHEVTEYPSEKSKRLIGIDDLRNDNLIRYTDDTSGTEAISDDVLIAWDGANAGTIGYGKRGYIGSTIARLRVRSEVQLFAPFLGLFLRSKFDYLRKTATGATIPHISRNALESIPLPNVEFDDQIRIAHLLGKAEGMIAQRKQHLQQLDDLLKSVFLEMFGFRDGTYTQWIIERLALYTEVVSGVTKGKKYSNEELIEVPYMRVANVQDGHFVLNEVKTIAVTQKEIDQYLLRQGDLLLTEGGDPDKLGRGSVWEEQIPSCIHQNHIFRVRIKDPSELNPYYLSALVGSRYGKGYFLKSAKQTTGIASINSTQLKDFPTVIPPIDLQNQFAAIAEKIESLRSRYQQSLTDLEGVYGALSQQAFKEELDLSRVQLPIATIEEKNALVSEHLSEQTVAPSINFPDSDLLLSGLESREQLKPLLHQWLSAYRAQSSGNTFSIERFMTAAQIRLAELHSDSDFDLGIDAYEHIKNWVFEALKTGTLAQRFDDHHNRIHLESRSVDWGSW